MKKRFISSFLVIIMLLSFIPIVSSAAMSGECGDNATWVLDDKTLTISGTGEIYYGGWGRYNEIEEIIISNGITSILERTFRNTSDLKYVTLPETLQTIGDWAFAHCDLLRGINMPYGLVSIGSRAFYSCDDLSSVTFYDKLKSIGDFAFYDSGLRTISIPESVTDIGVGALASYEMREINVDNNNLKYCSVGGVMYSKDKSRLIQYAPAKYSGYDTTWFEIPSNVTVIGDYAFCLAGVKRLEIPPSVKEIGYSFSESDLSYITVDENNQYYSSEYGVLFNKNLTELVYFPPIDEDTTHRGTIGDRYEIPSSVTSIYKGAFERCNLSNITIPNSVRSIGGRAFLNCTISSIEIPNGVKSIGEETFAECVGLTDVILPTTLESIGDDAFAGCSELDNIKLPQGLRTIGEYAFDGCKLSNINLPNSITSIGEGAFGYTGITEIQLPNQLTVINDDTFLHCRQLTSISIPSSVKRISYAAFLWCDNLNSVYYAGSQSQWNAINIELDNDCLLDASIYFNGKRPIFNKPKKYPEGRVNFAFGRGSANYSYDDNYFSSSSYTYNHNLAKMSIRFAVSTFGTNDYKTNYSNAATLLKDIGFDEVEANNDYKNVPQTDTIGVIIGNKKIAYDNGNYTILAVGIRGGNYHSEWGGNFKVGNFAGFHEGFFTAREKVIAELNNYINSNDINGKIKIWVTGYSRAGATTNLTAAFLDEHPDFLPDTVTLEPKDIYAYCFEPPAGARNPSKDAVFENIFNIINENDVVPMVAPEKWGFGRYGVDKYIPLLNYTAPSSKYYRLLDKMTPKMKQYSRNENYVIDDFKKYHIKLNPVRLEAVRLYSEAVFYHKLVDSLASQIKNTRNYEDNYQDALVYVGDEIIGKGNYETFIEEITKEFNRQLPNLKKEAAGGLILGNAFTTAAAKKTLRSVIKNSLNAVGAPITDKTLNELEQLAVKLAVDGTLTDAIGNSSRLKQMHEPYLCMAWLEAINESDYHSTSFREVKLTKQQKNALYAAASLMSTDDTPQQTSEDRIEVYNSENELVATIRGGEIEDAIIPVDMTENGEIVFYMSPEENYYIKAVSDVDTTLSYTAREPQDDGTVKTVSYSDIDIAAGEEVTATALSVASDEDTYQFIVEDEAKTVTSEVAEAEPVNITTTTDGNGSVAGGGLILTGENVTLKAIPQTNEKFLGWYNEDELVSLNESYSFIAENDVELTAKFTETTCEVIVMNGDRVIASQSVVSGSTVSLPENPQREKGIFKGYFTDENCTEVFDTATTFGSDTILYAEFEEAVKNGDWYYFINEDNTASLAGGDNVDGILHIPADIDGHIVSDIHYGAFNSENIVSVILPRTVTKIGENAFANCDNLAYVCYEGSNEEWNAVNIANGNESIENAKFFADFNSSDETHISQMNFEGTNGLTGSIDFDYVMRNSTVYCAVYDAENKLLAVKNEYAKAGAEQIDIDMSDCLISGDVTVRVFVWQEDTMKPICSVNSSKLSVRTVTRIDKDTEYSIVASLPEYEYNYAKDENVFKIEMYNSSNDIVNIWNTYDAQEFKDVIVGDVIQFSYDSDNLIQGRINNIRFCDVADVLDGKVKNNGQLYNWEQTVEPSFDNNYQTMRFDYRFKQNGTQDDVLYSESIPYSRAVVFNVSQVLPENRLYVTKSGFLDIDGTMILNDEEYEEIVITPSTKILCMEYERDAINSHVADTTTKLTINDLKDAKNYGSDCSKILALMSKGEVKLIMMYN